MNAIARRAIDTYANVGLETGVGAADPHRLIVMLYEGAMLALTDAKIHVAQRAPAAKGAALSKAIAIIQDGLKASLDSKAGGELSARLAALYDYMVLRLLRANIENRVDYIDEVSRLLGELRGAWEHIRPAGVAGSAHASPATVVSRTA